MHPIPPMLPVTPFSAGPRVVFPAKAGIQCRLWHRTVVFAIFATLLSVSNALAQSRPTLATDSLIQNSPRIAKFLIEVLGDTQTVNYRGFILKRARQIIPEEGYLSMPPELRKESLWNYSPDRQLALMINQGDDPDRDLWLYNWHGSGSVRPVEFCGTSCDYRGVLWLDNLRLLFVSTDSHDDKFFSAGRTIGYNPGIEFFDFAVDSAYYFESSPVWTSGKSTSGVTDSLIWKSPRVAEFLIKVLGDSQTVNYRGFVFKETRKINPHAEYSYTPAEPPKDTLWIYSPNRKLAMKINQGGDPDRELLLYNWHDSGRAAAVEFCGTGCDYRGLFWLDNVRLIFAQIYEHYDQRDSTGASRMFIPRLESFDFVKDSIFIYDSTPNRTTGSPSAGEHGE